MRIDLATRGDGDAFIELNRVVQDLHATAHPDIFKPASEVVLPDHWFAELVAQPGVSVWLARDDHGVAVGYLLAQLRKRPENPFQRPIEVLYIDQLAVRPDARERGVATALMHHARDTARALGIVHIELDVWSFNVPARRRFSALGFVAFAEKLSLRV